MGYGDVGVEGSLSIIGFYDVPKGKERWFWDLGESEYINGSCGKEKEGCGGVFGAVVGVEGKIYVN